MPVTKLESSEARNKAALAISSASPMRPIGMVDKSLAMASAGCWPIAGVSVGPGLRTLNDGGSIILTGSVAGSKGTPAFGTYSATKAAVRNFVRAWTVELKDRHIRSNVLSPGPTDTPAIGQQPEDAIARIVSTIPSGPMAEPEQTANAPSLLPPD